MSTAPNQAKPSSTAAPPQRTSSLAIASLVCSCALFCPVAAPLAGIVLGSAALRRIRASRGGLGGRRMALAGTFLGSALLVLQIGFVVVGRHHIQRHLEVSMIQTVKGFVAAAMTDDLNRASDFWAAGRSSRLSADDVAAFGAMVRERYGGLLDFHLVNQVETGSMGREVAAYFRFERGERSGWARFIITINPRSWAYETRLQKLVIEDPEQGDVIIPAEPAATRAP